MLMLMLMLRIVVFFPLLFYSILHGATWREGEGLGLGERFQRRVEAVGEGEIQH